MIDSIRNIWRPGFYHGTKKHNNFFEGWFYKLVDAPQNNTMAIIPGIYISSHSFKAHSFIQVLHGEKNESFYVKYNTEDFSAPTNELKYRIKDSFFTSNSIELNLKNEQITLRGSISFDDLTAWPIKLFSPGVMGWYGFIPFMECNHGVLSMNHSLKGQLEFNGELLNFDGGNGYIEKDWGTSFPSSYVWMQSNNFEKKGVSFSGSIAKIPWLGNWFRGFIVGLLLGDKLYRFTTYTGAKLNFLKVEKEFVEFELYDKRYLIRAKAIRTPGVVIHGPYDNEMIKTVSESLSSSISVQLSERRSKKIIFEGIGTNAGLDVNGKLEEIIG